MEIIRHVKVATLDNYTERVTADGTGSIEAPLKLNWPQQQELWIDRILIRAPNSSSFTAFFLYARANEAAQLREWVNVGPTNVAVESSPVVFLGFDQPLVARWDGLSPNVTATIVLTGRYMRRISRTVPDHAEEGKVEEAAQQLADAAAGLREVTGAAALGPARHTEWPDQG